MPQTHGGLLLHRKKTLAPAARHPYLLQRSKDGFGRFAVFLGRFLPKLGGAARHRRIFLRSPRKFFLAAATVAGPGGTMFEPGGDAW